MIYILWVYVWASGDKEGKAPQGFVCLHMSVQIPGMWRMVSEQQEGPCTCRSISCPPCRLASYLLNETVPTDLNNSALAWAPRYVHRDLCFITESPCARAEQHRQPWTKQWVDMARDIIGSFRRCCSFSVNAAVFFHLVVSYCGYDKHGITSDSPQSRDLIHTLPHITWMCGCDSRSC